ncbi:unnamed protein product [Rhodiola kirilowii]
MGSSPQISQLPKTWSIQLRELSSFAIFTQLLCMYLFHDILGLIATATSLTLLVDHAPRVPVPHMMSHIQSHLEVSDALQLRVKQQKDFLEVEEQIPDRFPLNGLLLTLSPFWHHQISAWIRIKTEIIVQGGDMMWLGLKDRARRWPILILKWDKHGISNLAGEISLAAGILMWVTTFPKVRQNMFELFFYTHYLYIVFVVFFALHLGAYFTCMTLPGFYLFVIDRYLRLLQSQQNVKLISARVLPCESVELNFAKSPGLKYPPTSCMFVKVPCVSRLQWHPFTVCSNSDLEEDIISVLIKSEGSWTRKLNQMLSAHPSIEHLQVSVEGPYGPESSDFFRHNTLVMVSGGSGIAPFISIIRGLIHAASNAQNTPKAILISAFKSSSELEMLDLLLPLSARSPSALSNLDIQIEAYVTREHEHSKSSKAISTICFKPHHSDAPISATLGTNSWLWLAMIISSSFAFSLLLIGFATWYFIYPVDKNTDEIYPRSIKTIIYMLSFCFSIVVTASVAFLWNKKHCAKEVDGVNDINMVPSVDIELETLPGKSLAHVTNVHYGVKPDLAKILSECGGSSVGVYVCGPKGLQSDVASICSSDSTGNRHFEFISFSW